MNMKSGEYPPPGSKVSVRVQILEHGNGLPLPAHATDGAAGADIVAALKVGENLVLKPGQRTLVPTGLVMEIPQGWEVQVRPRSGLAARHGITCLNTPGTIDSDYRGEVKVILANLGSEDFVIERGMRIAQLVLAPHWIGDYQAVDQAGLTERGSGGFGSTGF
ncbi:MAG: dUTP diphosphatase [Candidatus Wallbacteria bacterium HGW-Wallbacteria-1]|uniref:Deoxyuridine 5'-triphosphate nucleotidohydrolase n=1 Tax=Candidatus Wallbacteria bacterium HGW-Wallbacteria-1 TaxID=2013854 RepID=A0A2N1PU03_9BACT|nr:MAG: dUTP diphosphatase [Candidatus Wallbacteria bacterium HGW-Wallbacteria-1]